MSINIDEGNLKQGLMGLVVGLVEIIQEVLERQAIRRMEGGRLSVDEIERLGTALSDLKVALEKIKKENDLEDAVRSLREGLDDVAGNIVNKFNPESWNEEAIKA